MTGRGGCGIWRDQVVDCGLQNVGPLLFSGCFKLLDIGRNWNAPSYTPNPEHRKQGQRVTCGEYAGRAKMGMFTACVQIPATWGCALSCCNMRGMAAHEWHDKVPQELITSSPCIQIAISATSVALCG